MVSSTEASLMEQAMMGDRNAYAGIVELYWDRIRGISYLMLHDGAAADDVAQETFTRGLEKVKGYRAHGKPLNWFYAIAVNLCRRNFRSARKAPRSVETGILETGRRPRSSAQGILTSLCRRETHMILAVALGHLTERQKETFVLHYIEEVPYGEIGNILGISPEAARALSQRARETLRSHLGKEAIQG